MLKLAVILFTGTLALCVPTGKLAARDCVTSDQCSLSIGHCAQDIIAPAKGLTDVLSIPSCFKAAECVGSVDLLLDDLCCFSGMADYC
ncbi:hypothetical protein PsYK624_151250 [Phanerochaete sordida]|uniref:Hydrophobin n=1 Tax=Phanerochaete sordida TaxID=48140 RepID=A0A9P3GPU5_9APHY|nr:hypothetical protein PsYK624_151250 [Phanerochaete sordida]